MKLIIHIGFHKTGTSAIQKYCANNRDFLAAQGLLFPKTGLVEIKLPSNPTSVAGHRSLRDFLETPADLTAKDKLAQILAEVNYYAGINTVLISDETFSNPNRTISPYAKDFLAPHFSEIQILTYLRRQDIWADSFYREKLCWVGRQRETRGFEQYFSSHLPTWLNYEQRLSSWAEIFGEESLLTKSFDDRLHADAVKDFFSAIDMLQCFDASRLPDGHINPSLPRDLVPLLLKINSIPLPKEQRQVVIFEIFNQLETSKMQLDSKPLLTDTLYERLLEACFDQNKRVADRFITGAADKFCFCGERNRPVQKQLTEKTLTEDAQARLLQLAAGFELEAAE